MYPLGGLGSGLAIRVGGLGFRALRRYDEVYWGGCRNPVPFHQKSILNIRGWTHIAEPLPNASGSEAHGLQGCTADGIRFWGPQP